MIKRIIELETIGQRLRLKDNCSTAGLVNQTRRYLYIHFNFDHSWNGMQATAVFTSRLNRQEPIMLLLDEDDMVEVPQSCLAGDAFYVSCFAGYLYTSNSVEIKMAPAGPVHNKVPTPDEKALYYQMMDKLDELKAQVKRYAHVAKDISGAREIPPHVVRRMFREEFCDRCHHARVHHTPIYAEPLHDDRGDPDDYVGYDVYDDGTESYTD